jgi:hypothetical protein
VGALEKIAGVPAGWVKELDVQISEIKNLIAVGQSPVEELIEAGKLAESTGSKLDAWDAFAPGWLKTAAGGIAEIRGLSYLLSGAGLAADAGTFISPLDKGAMGWADRGVAGFNAA